MNSVSGVRTLKHQLFIGNCRMDIQRAFGLAHNPNGYDNCNARLFSSAETTTTTQTTKKKKKKRSRRSNLQRSKTPKQLSYKKDRIPKASNNQNRRGSNNRKPNHKPDYTAESSSSGSTVDEKNNVKSSIAYSIVDQWDEKDSRERITNDNDDENDSLSSSKMRRGSSTRTFQLGRFLDKQEEFCETLHEYRQVWYPQSQEQQNDWKVAMALQHPDPNEDLPWLDLNPTTIVDSEDLFRRVCSSHHDLFVACASYLTDLSETHYHETHRSLDDEWTDQDLLRMECEELLTAILPSWERLRRERALLVEAHRPPEEDYQNESDKHPSNHSDTPSNLTSQEMISDRNTPDVSYQNNQWVGWLKGMISGTDQQATTQDHNTSSPSFEVTAHSDPECAPNHYHYTKLVGRLYFHYLPLERHNRSNPYHLYSKTEREGVDNLQYKQALAAWEETRMEILAKRAEQMQSIVDQSLLPLTPNRNNNGTSVSKPQHLGDEDTEEDTSDRVLTDKIVRLLIRSYLDMESLSAAQQAERVYHRHPNHRKRLLWYVTMCYLKVITTNKKALTRTNSNSSEPQKEDFLKRNQECSTAAKRICELVSSKHAKEAREFQHCSTIAFEALAILPQYGRRGLKGYYDRVHSLGILKFGPKVWEALLKDTTDNHSLQTKSSRRRKRKPNRKSPLDTQASLQQESSQQPQSAKSPIDLAQSLHSKDHRILNYLIQIYSHEEKDLPRALRLLQVSLDLYSPYDLKESLDRSTFHKLLKKLSEQRRKAHIEQRASQSEFDIALGLLDSMVAEHEWFPTEETFRILFSMIPYGENPGQDAEVLRSKLEACRFLSQEEVLLNPLEASALTLRAWLQTQQQHQHNPSRKALAVLKAMQVGSSSLFGNEDAQAVTPALYSLALEVCAKDVGAPAITHDASMEIFELVVKSDDELLEKSCGSLLKVVGNFSKNNEESLLRKKIDATKRICNALDEMPSSILEFLQEQASYLRLRHPELYQEHLAELGLLKEDGSQS